MDLELFLRINRQATELQLAHARVRHRFLIPIEHQQLLKEYDEFNGNLQLDDSKLRQKRGILVRHQIRSRLISSASNDSLDRSGEMNPFQNKVSSLRSNFKALLCQLQQRERNDFENPKVTYFELQSLNMELQKLLLGHASFVKQEMKDRETRSDRIETLQQNRALLEKAIGEMQEKVEEPVSNDKKKKELESLRDQSGKLGRMVDILVEAMPLLKDDWSESYGPDEAQIFICTLELLMNDTLKSADGVEITEIEEDCHFLAYMFRTGLIRSHSTVFGKIHLNFEI